MVNYILLLLAIVFGVWLWMDSLRSKELATALCAHACRAQEVQLLDGTVFLTRLGLKRDSLGQLRIRRWYRFDYSIEGIGRRRGNILLLGMDLEVLDLNLQPDVD